MVPTGRYVDDFFGALVVLSILTSLLGFPSDYAKNADHAAAMTVLGSLCTLSFADRILFTQVDAAKAAKHSSQLREIRSQVCSPGNASKLAGRLSFAVTQPTLSPFAQAHAPMPRNQVSRHLAQSVEWFLQYLCKPPASARRSKESSRTQCVSWSDAAGQTRWVAAIVSIENDAFWRLQTPAAIFDALLDRGDHFVGWFVLGCFC